MIKKIDVFKALVGSHAYGTNIESSDKDYKSIYIQPTEDILKLKYKEQINYSKDDVGYEVQRFIELVKTANPTILELLFSPSDCIIQYDKILDSLFKNKEKFLTKQCRNSFGGYAVDQIKKAKGLDKKQNWEKNRISKKSILDFCYIVLNKENSVYYNNQIINKGVIPLLNWISINKLDLNRLNCVKLNGTNGGYQLYYGNNGIITSDLNRLKTSEVSRSEYPIATMIFNEMAFNLYKKEYESYNIWLKERNESRYVDFKQHGQMYDGKNLLHCRRLLDTAIELFQTGKLNVRRSNTDYLISIRMGKVKLEDIIKKAEDDILYLDELYNKSTLPNSVDENLCINILYEIRKKY